jgi:ankyrin repeat protein
VRHLLRIGASIDYRSSEDLTALHQAVLSGFEDVVELLLDHGTDVNAPSLSAGYPLCLAVLKDRFNIMKKLIEFRADVKLADPELGTPLHCAAFTGNRAVGEFLIQHGAVSDPVHRVDLQKLLPYQDSVSADKPPAQIPWTSEYRWTNITPLMIAVLATNLKMAELLFGTNKAKRSSSFVCGGLKHARFQPLHAAARWGSSEMVALTIVHSEDVNLAESNGSTALIGATLSKRPDTVRQLLQAGASRDSRNSMGNTALTIAGHFGFDDCLEELVNAQASLDILGKDGKTAIMRASSQGHESCVRRLASSGASLDRYSADGDTALILASYHGFDECVKALIDAKVSLDLLDKDGKTAIMCASLQGHKSCVGRLAKSGASLDDYSVDGDTALILASYHGSNDCVEHLIDARASLDLVDGGGVSALMWAALNGHDVCVRRLIKAGASLNLFSSTTGRTALIMASSEGHDNCVRLLIEAGASLDNCTKTGTTALIAASISGHGDCVKQLIEAGASVDQHTEDDCTALVMASVNGRENCVEQLLRAGASLATKTKRLGSTALYEAVLGGHTNCAQMLCDHGANVNAQRLTGSTPLYRAARDGQLECVQMLLERQADPNLAEEEGWTPLMIAIQAATPHTAAIVEILLHAGADLTARTDDGDTALHFAAGEDQTQIAKMMLDGGASMAVMNADDERPLDVAETDSATYAFLKAWDKEHNVEPEMRLETQKTHEDRKKQKAQTTRKGWTRTSRRSLLSIW